jgi:hypothetical protein
MAAAVAAIAPVLRALTRWTARLAFTPNTGAAP